MNKEGDIGGYPILQYHKKKKKKANTEIPVMLTIGSLLLLVITDRKHYTVMYI